jgi:hypothetical protein
MNKYRSHIFAQHDTNVKNKRYSALHKTKTYANSVREKLRNS